MAEASRLSFLLPDGFIKSVLDLAVKQPWSQTKTDLISHLFNICSTSDQAELIISILSNYSYVDGNELSDSLEKITNQICKTWKLDCLNTCIICKDIEGKTDSSAALQQMIKPHFAIYPGWSSNNNFRSNIEKTIEDKSILNMVLVDDFSGSGKSLKKLCDWIESKCNEHERKSINVYAAFIGCMQKTIDMEYGKNFIDLFYVNKQNKLISDYFENEIKEKIEIMKNIEKNHGSISKSISLGYDRSEAGFTLQNFNTPNNVFPIFWMERGNKPPIFPRLKK